MECLEYSEWGVPGPVLAHPRFLGPLWKVYARLWILDYNITELMNESDAGFVLLMPSGLLIALCRVPFIPLDALRWLRRRRRSQEEYRLYRDFYYTYGGLAELV